MCTALKISTRHIPHYRRPSAWGIRWAIAKRASSPMGTANARTGSGTTRARYKVCRRKPAERAQSAYPPSRTWAWPASEFLWLAAVSILVAGGLFLVFKAKTRAFGEIEQGLATRQLLNLNDLSTREDLLPFLGIVSDPVERQFIARNIYNASGKLPHVGALARIRVPESEIRGARGLNSFKARLDQS